MIWANPRDVILYPRSSCYHNNFFSVIFLILYIVLVFNLEKNCENLCLQVSFLTLQHHDSISGSMLEINFT